MSDSAKEYYDKALSAHRIYANQLEAYLDYCEECKTAGKEPAHPKQWVCGEADE